CARDPFYSPYAMDYW
nr:immunoglobulin heavy chain junction region [Mus musculus]